MRILIVEDEFLVALELEDLLKEAGHDVVGLAVSGEQAIPLAERLRPDVAVCDMRLAGDMDGVQVAEKLMSRWGIRSLFVTGNPEEAEAASPEAKLAVLGKPVAPWALISTLAAIT